MKLFPSLHRRPQPSPADLSLLSNGAPQKHTSPVLVTSPGSPLPCPWHPLLNGLFDFYHWLFSPAPGSQTPGSSGSGVFGGEKQGCLGCGRGQVVVSLAPGESVVSVVLMEWGRNHAIHSGRMKQQSRYTRFK